ncbi:MAG TPA: TonB-dependent receptor [Bryobacteraceae bacterium]|nr:TonB-dependent receptor [Bryobacteraceae bacterium]HPU73830.1 TonB-dependent receptor [Bryobacteraceae bacterium]
MNLRKGLMLCRNTKVLAQVIGFWVLVAAATGVGWSQTGRGTIQGFITDSTGASVPEAKVQVIQIETNSTLDLATNVEGFYNAPSLPVGNYRVVVTKEGFKSVSREPIEVGAEVVRRVDFTLTAGDVVEAVTVTAEAPILDVSTAASPTSVDSEVVESLPIISLGAKRNITQLLVNVPGLTSYDPNNRESATWQPKMYGSASGHTEAFIDGGPGAGISTGRGALEEVGPSIEMVGEFSVVTNAFNAEYGGFGSWFTNVTIKSGTNEVHGSFFDHYSNNALNARSFFQPKLTHGNQNEGGVTLGGPVYLPKIYDGRNKTFFFVSEGLYFTRNGPSLDLRTVPTAAFKQGDFRELVNAAGAQIPIFDPRTTRPDGSGSYVRDPYPDNIIPPSQISSVAKKIVAFMPDPDIPGQITQNFYSRAFSGKLWPYFNNYVTTAKVDHNVSTKQKLSVTYMNQIRHRQLQGENVGWFTRIPWGSEQTNPLDFITFQEANSWKARVNHDYIFSPSVLNHVTVSVDRYVNLGQNATNGGGWLDRLGLTGIPADNGAFPAITFSGGTAAPMNINRAYDNRSYELRTRIDESLTWIRGKHSFKFGFSHSRIQVNTLSMGGAAGSFTFRNTQTSQPNAGSNYSRWGHPFASFLIGAVDTASATIADMIGTRVRSWALFAQDEWHVTPRLTLSYGLRWDYTEPPFEVNNKFSSFRPDIVNPAAGGLLGGLAFETQYGAFQKPWKRGFGPRLGLAYRLGENTVIRASGGLYYAAPNYGSGTYSSSGYTISPSFASADGYTPVYYWDTESFPQSFMRPPVLDPSFLNGQSIYYIPENRARLPQIASWMFGIQRQLGPRTSVDVSYMASRSTHLNINQEINVTDARHLPLGSLLLQPINSPEAVGAGFTEPFPGFANQKGANTVAAALKPYPHYTSVNVRSTPDGNSSMHSLQIRGNQRLSRGLTLMGYFTWMKVMTDNTAQYPLNRAMGYSVDRTSVPAVFGVTWTYELPFGEGRRFGGSLNPFARQLVSGWQVNGFVRYQSGYALAITAPNTLSALGYASKTADYIGGTPTLVTNPREFDPNTSRYLNAAAFGVPGTYTFGNLAPTLDWLRGFTAKAEAIQIAKSTRINERWNLDLGLDLTNPFNFHRWVDPATDISDSLNFGRVTKAGEGRALQITAKILF